MITTIMEWHRKNFIKAVAVVYTFGTIAHVFRLVVNFKLEDMPYFPDWVIVILGTFGLTGLIMYSKQIAYRGKWEILTHWLIVLHLGVSVVFHIWILLVNSHSMLSVFP